MRFFRRDRNKQGWLALAFQADGIATTSVTQGAPGKPAVTLAGFHPEPSPTQEAFEKLGKELHAGSYRCSALLRPSQYQILSVEAPNVPPDELRTAVRWRLKDMLDFHVDDATIDVLDIPVDASGGARAHNMFAIAARNKVIEQVQRLCLGARWPLSVIDIPEMAQRNIAARLEPEGRGLAMLSFNSDGGLLTISFRGELHLVRRIDIAPEHLAEPDLERRHASFDRITLELQRSLDHFDRQFHYISVAKLMLAPNDALGLESYLASNLYTPVESFTLDSVFDLAAVPELATGAAQQRFFLPLGAALRVEEVVL